MTPDKVISKTTRKKKRKAWEKPDADTRDTVKMTFYIKEGLGIVKVLTLRCWIAEGKLRAVKMGRAWVVMGRDLMAAIDNWPGAK